MKKIFFLLASVILLACSENERMVYDEHMHDIYYSIVTDTRDSLYVSLLMADQILETTVDVKMLGNVLTKPQKFTVSYTHLRAHETLANLPISPRFVCSLPIC